MDSRQKGSRLRPLTKSREVHLHWAEIRFVRWEKKLSDKRHQPRLNYQSFDDAGVGWAARRWNIIMINCKLNQINSVRKFCGDLKSSPFQQFYEYHWKYFSNETKIIKQPWMCALMSLFTFPISQMCSEDDPSAEQTPAKWTNSCEKCCMHRVVFIVISRHSRTDDNCRYDDETNGIPAHLQISSLDLEILVNAQIVS